MILGFRARYELFSRILPISIFNRLFPILELEQLVLELTVFLLQRLDHLEELLVDLGLVFAHGLLGAHVGHEKVAGLLAGVGGEQAL